MPKAVFVHGNPETAAIWSPMMEYLSGYDVEALSPPGFGAAVPDGFGATADDYFGWLVAAVEGRSEPVDLVGHDWGAGHVIRVAIERPDLIRSWAIDIAGALAPDYVWHDMARLWQTPGEGEQAVQGMAALPLIERAAIYESLGISAEVAMEMSRATDDTMGRCILALYRSASQPVMSELGQHLSGAALRPGLVIIATEDTYTGGEQRARWAAEQANAKVALLNGLGHWWMTQDPAQGAAILKDFWSGLS